MLRKWPLACEPSGRAWPFADGGEPALDVQGGKVVVVDCYLRSSYQYFWPLGPTRNTAGVVVRSGAALQARGCRFQGGNGTQSFSVHGGGDGALVLAGGTLHADRCTFEGGAGFVSATGQILPAGFGLRTAGSTALFDCSSTGGGRLPPRALGNPNDVIGADAVRVLGGTIRIGGDAAAVLLGGETLTAGVVLPASCGLAIGVTAGTAEIVGPVTQQPAAPGAPVSSGPVTLTSRRPPTISCDGTYHSSGETRADQPVLLHRHHGDPNAAFVFGFGLFPNQSTLPGLVGDLWIDLGIAMLLPGTLDATGSFAFGFVPDGLFPGLYGWPLLSQAAMLDTATGSMHMSNCDMRIYSL